MATKITNQELIDYKITTYERAIIFSCLMLGSELTDKQVMTFTDNINITSLPVRHTLLIKLSLPYDKDVVFKKGGNFAKSLTEVHIGSITPILIDLDQIDDLIDDLYPLGDPPIWIDTYEEYIFWLLLNYQSEMILNNEVNFKFFSIKIDFNNNKILLEINLPIDYQKQLILQNYIASVTPIYLWGKTITPPEVNELLLGNNGNIGNDALIGN